MPTVTGTLRDFKLDTLNSLSPRVIFTASEAAVTSNAILSTRPIVVIPNAAGGFTVELQSTDSVQPLVFYRIRVEWLESDDGYVGVDLLDWPLYVPAEGGSIGDLLGTPSNPMQVWIGLTPPPSPVTPGTWWLVSNPDDVTDPRNTGELFEWS